LAIFSGSDQAGEPAEIVDWWLARRERSARRQEKVQQVGGMALLAGTMQLKWGARAV